MIKKNMLLVALLVSVGTLHADCPDYSDSSAKCAESCSQKECNLTKCDAPCYRMIAMLCEDGEEVCRKEGPTKSGDVLCFGDYGVRVSVVEMCKNGVVVRVGITNKECPMSKSCKDECRALTVEDESDEPCADVHYVVLWEQEVVISCAKCPYSMKIVVEKSE